MGAILDWLLTPRAGPITSLNGGKGALKVAGAPPVNALRLGQTITLSLLVPHVGRGYLLHYGPAGWDGLPPPDNNVSWLMSNGAGANVSWVKLQGVNGATVNRITTTFHLDAPAALWAFWLKY